ncbi:nucleoside-diphosphate sugar epimerase/dehydratase [Marisediminicola antarctica]|nr:nucleoside-diphosphate sugar epimerase/dehydratase [Marisediminicola antarctica]
MSDYAMGKMQSLYSNGPLTRFGTQYAFDAVAWTASILLAVLLRYDFAVDRINWISILLLCIAASALQFGAGFLFYLYRGRHPYGSFAEVRALSFVVLLTTTILAFPLLGLGPTFEIPRSTIFIAAPIAFLAMGVVRYVKRLILERANRPLGHTDRALVYGAGYLGSTIVRRMVTDRESPYLPVGLLDDDPKKRNLWLHGIRVQGTVLDLAYAVRTTRATVLVVAIGRADSTLLREISDAALHVGVAVKVLPPLEEVLDGKSRLKDLRDVSIEDLIGRHPVDTEVESIAGYLQGMRVLVTGAGGSIGSELCRQISRFGPSELIMLDHDETGLQSTQLSILGHGLLDTRDVVLASIRDRDALERIFEERRPDVVFHAAALKHLPMLEQYPDEAWKSNVLGTRNVLEAAEAVNVGTFVNISTDKAANPTSVLGHSKRVAEKLTAWSAQKTGLRYLSVRFGNVIGSRGSMLPIFTSIIEAGGPLTITHRDVTRFFMTIPEACQLVVQAGGIGRPGEVLILDMGEPVRILDVAQRMIDMSGKDIAIVYTGLRPGEKLHEELIGVGETDHRPIHPQISHTSIDWIDPLDLDRAQWEARCRAASVAGFAGSPIAGGSWT